MYRAFSALFLVATLSGCATSWVVDSNVKSFATPGTTVPPGATYRFERLPSQQADTARQEGLDCAQVEREPGRAAIDHAAHGRAVALAEGGDAEGGAEGVAGHGAVVRFPARGASGCWRRPQGRPGGCWPKTRHTFTCPWR